MSDTLKNKKALTEKTVSLLFLENDINSILELLIWTQDTAAYLATQDSIKDNTEATVRLTTYAANASMLINYIAKSTNIGEPNYDIVN